MGRLARFIYFFTNGGSPAKRPDLPSDYRKVIGLTFSASTYYEITDFKLSGSDTVRISFSVNKACNVFGCYTNTSATDNYSLYMTTSSGSKYLRYGSSTYNSYIASSNFGKRFDVVISPEGSSGMPVDSVITPATFTASANLCIGTTSTGATSSKLDGNIWGNIVVDRKLKLIPCERVSDGALGYYDTYKKTFFEATGSEPTSLGYDD